MAVNKVVYGNRTLIDISDSTVTANDLRKGVVAYTKSGDRIVGLFDDETKDITTSFSLTVLSGYALSSLSAYQSGNTIELFAGFNNKNAVFPSGSRFQLAAIASTNYRPKKNISICTPCSNALNYFVNRSGIIMITNTGDVLVDRLDSTDIKEIFLHAVYLI